ncbi:MULTISPECIES: MATE family efflux transporter [Psychrilyobacter]|uniref:Multidrug export protein MepA n=1 Tax=Psychrilyobacter piezotolerans TaxID=2293438 RepID=A0ABX9KJK8_9FUSO|nr:MULTISPECIES: MATE family efflux transporter [Psychrilyobacter]MCS5421090.1 MATE family efflux transporter [Psychrilyobacter sp. S5]NDI76782.1 MATE family efflux transporter [Psychrilyobacter piezotolerans]RDE65066.1 MATE family efflux transporter [Psychrilyobacter sp. S5]REI42636.1 MATE family efflux transporter [Psychrilyobacter piezotolerans]
MNITIKKKGITKTLFKYAFPSILSMWIFSLYTIVDGIFVGRGVGAEALAAVNLSMPFLNFSFAISIMISIGASTLISTCLGRGELKKSREYFTLSLCFLGLIGFIICSASFIFRYELANFLGARREMIPLVVEYLSTLLFFNTFYLIAYALEVLIKVEGKPMVAMFVVGIAAVTNIILDYFLVIVFPLGLRGAAIATGCAQVIQGIILVSFFLKKNSTLKFIRIKLSLKKLFRLIKIGIPDFITELSVGFILFAFNRVIFNSYGTDGLAVFSVIGYTNNLVLMTMLGLTQGMQPIISYLNGQEDFKRKKQLLFLTLKAACIIGIFSYVVVLFFSKSISSLFLNDLNLIRLTAEAKKIFSLSFIMVGINIVTSGFFTAIEHPKKASIISLARGVILILILLIILPYFFGKHSVWIVTTVSELFTLFISITLIKFYKNKKVITIPVL